MIEFLDFIKNSFLTFSEFAYVSILGIIIFLFFKNKKKNVWGIVILSLILIKLIFETYFLFSGYSIKNLEYILMILNLLLVFVYLLFFVFEYKKINKILYFIVLFISLSFIFLDKMTFLAYFLRFSLVFFIGLLFVDYTSGKINISLEFKKKGSKFIILSFLLLFLISISFLIMDIPREPRNLSGELHVYNWEDYFSPEILEKFENEFGVKVIVYNYYDEEEAFQNFKNNLNKYDLMIFSDEYVKILKNEDLISKINKRGIPNFKNLNKRFKELRFDFNNDYSIPYTWGTTGIVVNKNHISLDKLSWEILWDTRYTGRIATVESPSEVFAMALKYIGKNVIPQNDFEVDLANDFLLRQKEMVLGNFDPDTLFDKMIDEELWGTQIYSDSGYLLMEEDSKFKYFFPEEGGTKWIDNFVIPKNSNNQKAAEAFINYFLDFENSNKNSEYLLTGSVVEDSKEISDENYFRYGEYFTDYDFDDNLRDLIGERWEDIKK